MRERERGRCLLCVTAAACGEEEDERSLPLRFLDSVFLSHSGIFCSLCAAVVFPTLWVFQVTSCVSTLFLFLCIYFVHTFYIRLWPNVLVERILTECRNINYGRPCSWFYLSNCLGVSVSWEKKIVFVNINKWEPKEMPIQVFVVAFPIKIYFLVKEVVFGEPPIQMLGIWGCWWRRSL